MEVAREAEAFVTRWRARTGEVTHARHRNMLHVILGETLELKTRTSPLLNCTRMARERSSANCATRSMAERISPLSRRATY